MTGTDQNADQRIGQVVGDKFRIVRVLGEGGMGRVYEAQHTTIGRRFAIKFLHSEHSRNRELVARFQREAQAAGGLENENIAGAFDLGCFEDGVPYLAMEFLEGEDLARLLARTGPLPVPRAAYVMLQACRGLSVAHARGIIHRDLKPENLFICRRNDGSDLVKILDFGIAKLHADASVTRTGTTMGTPAYMSLEQARGAKDADLRSDIYALGVILYEMLSGQKPHPGDSYSEVLYHLFTQEPERLETLRPSLPAGLADVVHRAMAREAGDRYGSVVELAEALTPFAERAVTPLASLPTPVDSAAATMASPWSLPAVVGSTDSARSGAGPNRRIRRVLVAGGFLALAIAIAVALLLRGRGEPGATPNIVQAPLRASGAVSTAVPARPEPSVVPAPAVAGDARQEPQEPPTRPGGRPPGQPADARSAPSSRGTALGSSRKNSEEERPVAGPKPRPFDRRNPYGG